MRRAVTLIVMAAAIVGCTPAITIRVDTRRTAPCVMASKQYTCVLGEWNASDRR